MSNYLGKLWPPPADAEVQVEKFLSLHYIFISDSIELKRLVEKHLYFKVSDQLVSDICWVFRKRQEEEEKKKKQQQKDLGLEGSR